MDASLQTRAEQLAKEIAGQAETVDDLNDLMRLMMKSTIQRMRVARPFWVAPTILAQKTVPYDSILSQNRRWCAATR